LTGIGGCAAFAGSIKTCETPCTVQKHISHFDVAALNWPNHRGTATAFPLSAFGLSAFYFSAISSLAFPDDTAGLLLLLAIATFSMVFVGSFFLRIVPSYSSVSNADERSGSDSPTLLKRTISGESKLGARRLSFEPGTRSESISYNDGGPSDSERLVEPDTRKASIEETSSLLSKSSESGPGDVSFQNGDAKSIADHHSHHVDVRGLDLLSEMKFYQLWLLLGLLTGIGLMTIKQVPRHHVYPPG